VRSESCYLLGSFSDIPIAVQDLQPAWPDGDCRMCITEINSSVDKLLCCRRVSLPTKVKQSLFRPIQVQGILGGWSIWKWYSYQPPCACSY